MSHVFLVGFMGAGKSTVGRLLAERLGRRFLDMDERIESEQGRSIRSIFSEGGESAFRDAERRALAAVLEEPDAVVACGGGVVTDDVSRGMLEREAGVVYLEVTPEEALARIGDTSSRPLIAEGDAASLAGTLISARETLYRSVAGVVVDTCGKTPEEVAGEIERALGNAGPLVSS